MQNTKNKIKENKYNPVKNNYTDYIHCIWYCVSNKPIDQNEIEVIKQLKKGQDILPLIVVYTNSKNEELVKKAEQIIKTEFNDIPFISVLAEPIENVIESFGLDKLLDMTLEICKKSVKSEAFITIKEIICDEIQKIYNKKNEDIKSDVNNEMIYKFINSFNKVILDKSLYLKYIFDLLEIIFIGYLKDNNKEIKLNTQSQEDFNTGSISNFIDDYIKLCKKNAADYLNSIKQEKSLKYLDKQAKIEKKEFKQNINVENKNNQDNFINIIETFLNSNFYFIAQKYIIYRLITDVNEDLSEEVENQINEIVSEILKSNEADDWSKEIYYQKFDDLKETVKQFYKEGGFTGNNAKKIGYNNKTSNQNLNNGLNDNSNDDCPIGPYPSI